MFAFRDLLDEWDKKCNVYLLCDNPGFDFGFINTYLDMFAIPVLNYKRTTTTESGLEYRNTHDSDSYARGFLGQGFDEVWLSNEFLVKHIKADINTDDHDHMPENDAKVIYLIHLNLIKYIKK